MASKKENRTRTDRLPGKRQAYEKNRKTILYRDNVCAICGQPVDKNLPAGHPMSAEVDHIVPLSRGGDPVSLDNLQLVHRVCNQRKANKLTESKPAKPEKEITNRDLPWSIDWLSYDGSKGWPPEDDADES